MGLSQSTVVSKAVFGELVVEDNGIGIPARDLPHLFERFYQVEIRSHAQTWRHGGTWTFGRKSYESKMHGGRASGAESVEGAGSKFIFLLPFEQKKDEPASARRHLLNDALNAQFIPSIQLTGFLFV